VAVRIRMKPMGRKHRHYYRIVAIDGRQPNDGRVIEELGTYDPHVADNDKNVTLNAARVRYWQSVGAKASDKVTVLLNKFLNRAESRPAAPPAEGEKKA
jgi:small subunit ribosomal protein S16